MTEAKPSTPHPTRAGNVEWEEPLQAGDIVTIDQEGCIVAGRYVSRKSVMVDVQGQKRESLLHTMELVADCVLPNPESGQFSMTAGDRLQFWGSTELDQLLSRVPQNAVVRIAYQGRQQLSGDRTLKKWEVRLAKKNAEEEPWVPSR